MKIIDADRLNKTYSLYKSQRHRLFESLIPFYNNHESHKALQDVSFSVDQGDVLGIVGRNGSGKSTLLKIISGLVKPTSGHISVDGTVAALLELGAGFNPELTGLENIYFTALYSGRKRTYMKSKIDEIVEFADIGKYIDQPVKTYSSGMYARLAFATSIYVEPNILILDEVLAVGDAKFQLKCIDKISEVKDKGATILFVSHELQHVKRTCNKVLWLSKGKVMNYGSCIDVCGEYDNFLSQGIRIVDDNFEKDGAKAVAKILEVKLNRSEIKPFEDLSLEITYEVREELADLIVGAAIYTPDRRFLFGPNTYLDKVEVKKKKGIHKVIYKINDCSLLPGHFYFDVGLSYNKGQVTIDYWENAASFVVKSDLFAEGLLHLKHDWSVDV